MTHYRLRYLMLFALIESALAADAQDKVPSGGFIPKRFPAFVGLAFYAFSAIIHWILFFRNGRQRFMLVLTVGMTTMAVGFAMRIVFAGSPYSSGLYIIMDLLILLSPCAFLATDYMLLARLTSTFDEDVQRCMVIRPSRIVVMFVVSDVITFILQAAGGGALSSPSSANFGKLIMELGLGLQLGSFALFTVVLLLFAQRLRSRFPALWFSSRGIRRTPFKVAGTDPVDDWRILFWTMCLTCIGILIRSTFRIAELVGGYTGYLALHEGYFYMFDALPLWVAMTLYCFVWPTRFLHSHAGISTGASAETLQMNLKGAGRI
ncbi:RTA1 like protein-domain-containing protein [Mycena latifolia]|nr:RTA1 like protein-domain-containing protein [Mycena latifolia]